MIPLSDYSQLDKAIWRTVEYMDLFDYPVTAVEIHRYLDSLSATLPEVEIALSHANYLVRTENYYHLPGRRLTVDMRSERTAVAQQLWPHAKRYGRYLAQLPFVRMIAVTGSLAMNNTPHEADVDYLIVTGNGRLWLCRAFIIAVVRLAARQHINLCPNYLITERALRFPDENLYAAHEVTQMIPLAGLPTYEQIRQENQWTARYLPNANGSPQSFASQTNPQHWQKITELPFKTPLGQWLEKWEMQRKVQKFHREFQPNLETSFSADWCKGHFTDHNRQTMTAYQQRTLER